MRFLAMTNPYVYEPEFCNPAAGWGKPLMRHWFKPNGGGKVEKNVRDARHQMLQGMANFLDLAALNVWLEQRCIELWRETPHGKQHGTIADVWAEEQAALMPLRVAFRACRVQSNSRCNPNAFASANAASGCSVNV